MKKGFLLVVMMLCIMSVSADNVMKKLDDGTCVVNTTEICKARGYKSYTPVEVHIKKGKVVKVVPLSNKETPKYFKMVMKNLLPQYADLKVAKAKKLASGAVDGCTGATMSAKAVQQNIKMALEYYSKNM